VPKHNAMNEYNGSERKVPCIPNLNTMKIVSLKFHVLCPLGKLLAIQWAERRKPNKAGDDDKNWHPAFQHKSKHTYVMNDDPYAVYFQLSAESTCHIGIISTKYKLDATLNRK
jgi:hypothetical protein